MNLAATSAPAPRKKSTLVWLASMLAALLVLLAIGAVGAYFWVERSAEQPKYTSVLLDEAFEVRDYPALVVAEVSRSGTRYDAVRRGFRPLASYIFAKERGGETISMTAPVTQTPEGAQKDWTIRFIMPSQYTLETLPKAAGDDVKLATLPAKRRAAIRFSGVATDELIASKELALREWMADRGLFAESGPTYAYYNHPWTPGFLRRNEVMFEIAAN